MTNETARTNLTITVVIPAYNEEKYLTSCLEALNNQTYPQEKYDILVIDNNSTDATARIAKSAGAHVITEKKQGYIFALNTGLQKATGEIIAITDADTKVHTDWLQNIAKTFADGQVVGAAGSMHFNAKSPTKNTILEYLYDLFMKSNFALNKPHLNGPNMMVRKSAFMKLKKINERFKIGGDVLLGLRLREFGKVVYAKNVKVTTSLRRYSRSPKNILKDIKNYSSAYVYTVWLHKNPHNELEPVR